MSEHTLKELQLEKRELENKIALMVVEFCQKYDLRDFDIRTVNKVHMASGHVDKDVKIVIEI